MAAYNLRSHDLAWGGCNPKVLEISSNELRAGIMGRKSARRITITEGAGFVAGNLA